MFLCLVFFVLRWLWGLNLYIQRRGQDEGKGTKLLETGHELFHSQRSLFPCCTTPVGFDLQESLILGLGSLPDGVLRGGEPHTGIREATATAWVQCLVPCLNRRDGKERSSYT